MIIAIVNTIDLLFRAYAFIILARVIFSWIRVDPYHPTWGPIFRFVFQATEPLMAPVRRMLPFMGGLDLSPLIVWFGLEILRRIIVSGLVALA